MEVWAYCLMSNHVHLVAVPESTIEAFAFKKEDIKILVTDLDEEMERYESLYQL